MVYVSSFVLLMMLLVESRLSSLDTMRKSQDRQNSSKVSFRLSIGQSLIKRTLADYTKPSCTELYELESLKRTGLAEKSTFYYHSRLNGSTLPVACLEQRAIVLCYLLLSGRFACVDKDKRCLVVRRRTRKPSLPSS